jgi:hypothetical protein
MNPLLDGGYDVDLLRRSDAFRIINADYWPRQLPIVSEDSSWASVEASPPVG